MPAAPSSDNLLLGRGKLFFDRFTAAGVKTGKLHLGTVDAFEILTEDDKLRKVEMMSAQANTYKEVTRQRTVTLKVTGAEFSPENVALLLMGDKAAYTQAATPIVDEVLAAAGTPGCVLGAYYKLALLGPYTGVTLEKDGSPDVALTLDTDWEWVDQTLGLVRILPTAVNIAAGDGLLANYTPTAYTAGAGYATVNGGNANNIVGEVLFVPDPASGPKMIVEVWKVSVMPEGPLGLIGEDWSNFQLQMTVLDDTAGHPSNPLYKVTMAGAV